MVQNLTKAAVLMIGIELISNITHFPFQVCDFVFTPQGFSQFAGIQHFMLYGSYFDVKSSLKYSINNQLMCKLVT